MIDRIIFHAARSFHSIQYKQDSNSSCFLTDSEAVCSNTARLLQQSFNQSWLKAPVRLQVQVSIPPPLHKSVCCRSTVRK